MAKKKPSAEDVPVAVSKSTVRSTENALSSGGDISIMKKRDDITVAHDQNSVKERYQRTLEKLDRVIGKAQAEKRRVLSALAAMGKQEMGSTADKQDDGGSIELKPEPKPEPVPERERTWPKPEQGNAYKLPDQKPQPPAEKEPEKGDLEGPDGDKP